MYKKGEKNKYFQNKNFKGGFLMKTRTKKMIFGGMGIAGVLTLAGVAVAKMLGSEEVADAIEDAAEEIAEEMEEIE